MRKRNGNSKSSSLLNLSKKQDVITITSEEQDGIKVLEQNLANAKIRLANFVYAVEQQKMLLLQEVSTAEKSFNDRVGGVAQAHGINTEDPADGQWNFNTTDMTFKRIG